MLRFIQPCGGVLCWRPGSVEPGQSGSEGGEYGRLEGGFVRTGGGGEGGGRSCGGEGGQRCGGQVEARFVGGFVCWRSSIRGTGGGHGRSVGGIHDRVDPRGHAGGRCRSCAGDERYGGSCRDWREGWNLARDGTKGRSGWSGWDWSKGGSGGARPHLVDDVVAGDEGREGGGGLHLAAVHDLIKTLLCVSLLT